MQQYMYCIAPPGLTLSNADQSLYLQSPTDLHTPISFIPPQHPTSLATLPPTPETNFPPTALSLGVPASQLPPHHIAHLPPQQVATSPCFTHIPAVAHLTSPQTLVCHQQQQEQIQIALVPAESIYLHAGAKRSIDEVILAATQQPMMSSQRVDVDVGVALRHQDLASSEAKKVKLESHSHLESLTPDQMVCKPSRVVHLRGIPSDSSESEVIQLGLPFGNMTNIVLAKKKNQALLEMLDVQSAQSMVNYYSERPAQIRGRCVYVQFSNHDQLKTETSMNGGVPAPQIICNSSGSSTQLHTANSQTESQDSGGEGQSRNVLRVIVENLFYPVTIDILKQIFSRYGLVQKIVTFNKNNSFQALIQYSDSAAANTAKLALNGQNIYHGCCQLRIDFSKLPTLNVRYNNEKSRDYTDAGLPAGDFPPSAFPFAGQPIAYAPHSGVLTPAYTVIPGFGSAALAYCTTTAGAGGAIPYAGQGVIPALQLTTSSGVRLTPSTAAHYTTTPLTSVLLVTNLNEERVTPDALFTLFGVYGDVMRVKIMYNKKDNALVQYADPNQAQIGLMHLDKVRLWDRSLKVTLSKHTLVQMPKEGQPDAGLTRDYTNSTLHRFKKLYSKNYNNIYAPSATLHLSNIPVTTTEEQLVDLFAQRGTIIAFKFFETDHKMALMQMSSIEEAVICLIDFHNHQLAETSHLRVSFSKSTISQAVRGGVREEGGGGNDDEGGVSDNDDINDQY